MKKGIVSTDEQVALIEKLLGAHKTLIQAEASITMAGLGITGQCSEDKRASLNNWLKRMVVVPVTAKNSESKKCPQD